MPNSESSYTADTRRFRQMLAAMLGVSEEAAGVEAMRKFIASQLGISEDQAEGDSMRWFFDEASNLSKMVVTAELEPGPASAEKAAVREGEVAREASGPKGETAEVPKRRPVKVPTADDYETVFRIGVHQDGLIARRIVNLVGDDPKSHRYRLDYLAERCKLASKTGDLMQGSRSLRYLLKRHGLMGVMDGEGKRVYAQPDLNDTMSDLI